MVQRHKVVQISSWWTQALYAGASSRPHQAAEAWPPPDHWYVGHCG